MTQGIPKDLLVGHRIEGIGDGQHPRSLRQSLLGQRAGTTMVCVTLRCPTDDLAHRVGRSKALQNLQTHFAMAAHQRRFRIVQLARFQQHRIRDTDFADVVQQCRHLQIGQRLRVQLDRHAPGRTGKGHAQGVGRGRRMFAAQGREQTAAGTQPRLNQTRLLGPLPRMIAHVLIQRRRAQHGGGHRWQSGDRWETGGIRQGGHAGATKAWVVPGTWPGKRPPQAESETGRATQRGSGDRVT